MPTTATALLNLTTVPSQWDLKQTPIIGDAPEAERSIFNALEIHLGSQVVKLNSPSGATFERRGPEREGSGPEGEFTIGRRRTFPYLSFEYGGAEPDIIEVTLPVVLNLLDMVYLYGWQMDSAPLGLAERFSKGQLVTMADLEEIAGEEFSPTSPADPEIPTGPDPEVKHHADSVEPTEEK